jgi:hypothetical protein
MNYTQLTASIKAYCENDFPQAVGAGGLTSAEQIARFVQQAEQRIYNSIQFPALRKNVTGSATASNKYLATPVDWLATFSLARINADGSYEYLLNKDVNYIREAFPFPAVSGAPTHYAIFDENTFILGPTPDASYSMELHYFYYPTSITTAGTSWLGDNLDSLLLYGSLLEAASFMKSDADVVKNYTDRYNEAFIMAKQLGDGKDRQDAYRSGQVRYPVK